MTLGHMGKGTLPSPLIPSLESYRGEIPCCLNVHSKICPLRTLSRLGTYAMRPFH